jgi:hypothetical protein
VKKEKERIIFFISIFFLLVVLWIFNKNIKEINLRKEELINKTEELNRLEKQIKELYPPTEITSEEFGRIARERIEKIVSICGLSHSGLNPRRISSTGNIKVSSTQLQVSGEPEKILKFLYIIEHSFPPMNIKTFKINRTINSAAADVVIEIQAYNWPRNSYIANVPQEEMNRLYKIARRISKPVERVATQPVEKDMWKLAKFMLNEAVVIKEVGGKEERRLKDGSTFLGGIVDLSHYLKSPTPENSYIILRKGSRVIKWELNKYFDGNSVYETIPKR